MMRWESRSAGRRFRMLDRWMVARRPTILSLGCGWSAQPSRHTWRWPRGGQPSAPISARGASKPTGALTARSPCSVRRDPWPLPSRRRPPRASTGARAARARWRARRLGASRGWQAAARAACRRVLGTTLPALDRYCAALRLRPRWQALYRPRCPSGSGAPKSHSTTQVRRGAPRHRCIATRAPTARHSQPGRMPGSHPPRGA
mmetsp:Transcript_384/g.1320  ORF Transcript_384/g.1320 Transcript_384/m.1320 type:complete len:203 (-) Transcript_384:278-886(-)